MSAILLPAGPLQSVSSVAYVDAAGSSHTLTVTTDYVVDASAEPARIYPAYGASWPAVRSQRNAITITRVCGYGLTGASVPAPLLDAVYLLIGDGYEFKQTAVQIGRVGQVLPIPSPVGYDTLVGQYRIYLDDYDETASDAVIAAPASEPVSLSEARAYLGIPAGFTARDAEITRLIAAARMRVEHDTGRSLITQARALVLDAWPAEVA